MPFKAWSELKWIGFNILTDALPLADDELAREAKEQEWRAGFEAMGSDPDVNNVEYMMFAAQEVVFDGENMVDLLDR